MTCGLPNSCADRLAARNDCLEPWREAGRVLGLFAAASVPLGVVTNCSEVLGRRAAQRLAVPLRAVVTAERAGFYKPDGRPYELELTEIGAAPERCLFVAGSAYDLVGTAGVGVPTWWHDRIGMTPPPGIPPPLARHRTLDALPAAVLDHRAG